MLYMGNVNRVIFWFFIPIVLIFYIVFRIFVWQTYDDGGRQLIAEQHDLNLSNRDDIDCLILGGSNAVFSLSAEQISAETNYSCYNLSLLNEGYAFSSYWNFIRSLPIDYSRIKVIVYSSVVPYRDRSYIMEKNEKELGGIGITGNQEFSLLGRSLASNLRGLIKGNEFFQSEPRYPLPTIYGDFYFAEFNNCRESVNVVSEQINDMIILENWAEAQFETISSIFPDAIVYFVLPSEARSSTFDSSLQNEIVTSLKNILLTDSDAYVIEQPPFSSSGLLCDAKHHANEDGRAWRTSNLIEHLLSS